MSTFVLPAGHHLKISAVASANYTQAAVFDISSDGVQQVHHRAQLYWSSAEFLLPVAVFNSDASVKVSGEYLYTDTDWGTSAEKIIMSEKNHLIIGFDDSRNYKPDNDFNDLVLDIYIVQGST